MDMSTNNFSNPEGGCPPYQSKPESRLRRRTRCGPAGAGPGLKVHLPVEDQASLFYNQPCNYCDFKENFDGRSSGEVKAMVHA
jgi:hypothetical protein